MSNVIKIKIIFTVFIKACSKCAVDFTICPELGNFSLILLPSVCKYGHRWYICMPVCLQLLFAFVVGAILRRSPFVIVQITQNFLLLLNTGLFCNAILQF